MNFFKKKTNFVRFENSYYSSRILRQICNNLVMKSQIEIHPDFTRYLNNWQVNVKTNVRVELMILLPYLNVGKK